MFEFLRPRKRVVIRVTNIGLLPVKSENGDWYDLKCGQAIVLKKGERVDIPMGVAMRLPKGYEAIVLPRSSTCRKLNIVMENSMGVIDNSYNGNEDIWRFRAYALEDTVIPYKARIAQFRIQKNQPKLQFRVVKSLSRKSRGGFGTSGLF
jgi:dUTP pyrophosphatase